MHSNLPNPPDIDGWESMGVLSMDVFLFISSQSPANFQTESVGNVTENIVVFNQPTLHFI
jgi:hypothetical protein